MTETNERQVNINDIAHLDSQRWERCLARTREIVTNKIPKPDKAQYFRAESKYPPALIVITLIMLTIVTLAAFLISAGKQIVAFNLINEFLYVKYGQQIGSEYVRLLVVAALSLSELGVILFGLAAHIYSDRRSISLLLRGFQGLSIMIAIAANVSVTAVNIAFEMPVFDWLVTLIAPIMVIGIGVVIEQLVSSWVLQRREKVTAYNAAIENYDVAIEGIDKHPDWDNTLGGEIYDQLKKISGKNKDLIDYLMKTALEENKVHAVYQAIVYREWSAHQLVFAPVSKTPETKTKRQPVPASPSQDVSGTVKDAMKLLQEHPEWANKSTRRLESDTMVDGKITISKSTWSRARRELENGAEEEG